MALPRRSSRSRLILALLVLTSVTVLTLDFRDAPVIGRAREIAASVLDPVRDGAEKAFEPVADAWGGITDYGELEDRNEALRQRVDELEGMRAVDEDAAAQLDELLSLADIDWAGDVGRIQARVVARSSSNFDRSIDLSKGTDAGIRAGMPVVAGRGLLGIVVQSTAGRATVQLLTDPDTAVGVRVTGGGALGTATGQGRGRELLVDTSLEPGAVVRRGVLLATSGTDRSRFPAGIPVARVTTTHEASSGLYLELRADALVDPDSVSFVSVLQWEPPP